MKTLEQLGVSPAPWRADTDKLGNENDVLCEYTSDLVRKGERRTKVVARCNAHFETFKADVHVIAAAPDMYKRGFELVSALEDWMQKYPPSEFSTFGQAYQLLVEAVNNFRAALAKAAGESEARQ